MRFRKRPVVIEAVQLSWDNWDEICSFAGVGKLSDGKPEGCYIEPETRTAYPEGKREGNVIGLHIPTEEGLMLGCEQDWIIKGVQGELYPCKPDIFEQTYEPVDMDE